MARLRALLKDGSWTSLAAAYLYATLLAAGPWLTASLALVLLPLALGFDWQRGDPEVLTFLVSFSWLAALSLIVGEAGGLAHARLTADLLWLGYRERVIPNLHRLWVRLLLAIQPLWLVYLVLRSDFPWLYLVELWLALGLQIGIVLFSALLATLRRYQALLLLYLSAFSFFALAVWLLAFREAWKLLGLLIAAQGVLLLGLMVASWRVCPFERLFHNDLRRVKAYRHLFWIGFGLNLAFWLDKFIFWWSPAGAPLHGALRYSALYDWPAFMAFLLAIPLFGLAFLLHEGLFLEPFHRYYRLVTKRAALEEIWQSQRDLAWTFQRLFRMFLAGQGLLLVWAAFATETFLTAFHFPQAFRVIVLNLFPGVIIAFDLLWMLLILLYFDERRHALRITILFVFLTAAFTWWTAHKMSPQYYGINLMLAAALPLLVALQTLNRLLARLSYYTFVEKHAPSSPVRYYTLELDHD